MIGQWINRTCIYSQVIDAERCLKWSWLHDENLTEFERRIVDDARWMGHSISEIVGEMNIPRSTVSRVCHEYLISAITTH